MPVIKHTHKYYKRNGGDWACALLDCSHFLPLNVVDTIQYKKSICWECGNTHQLDTILIKIDKPICHDCIDKQTTSPILAGIDEFLAGKQ